MLLDNGRLGLIDHRQTRRIHDAERVDFARIVVALNQQVMHETDNEIAMYFNTMSQVRCTEQGLSLVTIRDDEMMFHYAKLIFVSDEDSVRRGFSIAQVRNIEVITIER